MELGEIKTHEYFFEPDTSPFVQVVSRYVQPGILEGVSLNVVDYAGIRY